MPARRFLVAGVLAALLVSAAAVAVLYRSDFWRSGDTSAASQDPPITLPATVAPQGIVSVMAPIDGTVEDCFAAPGQVVAAGQLLARILSAHLSEQNLETERAERSAREQSREADTELSTARIEAARAEDNAAQANAALSAASSEYHKQQSLFQEGVSPRLAFEDVERTYRIAKADAESLTALARQAQDRVASLSRTASDARRRVEEYANSNTGPAEVDVRAPVPGALLDHVAERGDAVNPRSQPMFRIAGDLTRLDAVAQAAGPALRWVRPGIPARIEIAGTPGSPWRGVVREVDSSGRVFVGFESRAPIIAAGTRARVVLPRPASQ